jgi:hypothetical protein
MSELTQEDLRHVVSRLPKDVRNLLKDNRDTYLAGGFIRAVVAGEVPNDIDLFGDSKSRLEQIASTFCEGREGSRLHKSQNAVTILTPARMPVQFITRWTFLVPRQCADSFDFTVCKSVVWFSHGVWKSICDDRFYQDLAARRLTYTSPIRDEEAGGSMLRAIKYVKRGYSIQPASLGAVIARLSDKVRDSGVNSAMVITGLLREVDPMLALDGIDGQDDAQTHTHDFVPVEAAIPAPTTYGVH